MRSDELARLSAAFARNAIGACGPDDMEPILCLVDAALLVMLSNHSPSCAIGIADTLGAYIVEQARSVAAAQDHTVQ